MKQRKINITTLFLLLGPSSSRLRPLLNHLERWQTFQQLCCLEDIKARIEQLKEKDAIALLTEIYMLLGRLKKHHADRLPLAKQRIALALASNDA